VAEVNVIERNRLTPGEWYHGTSWWSKIAVWDGEFFLAYTWRDGCKALTLAYGTEDGFTPHRMVL